ncbi:MAG: hypothetical protein IKC32_05170 [Clostridia bacterium]|nr:hypothetical protein [Clostridia bacterium]
MKNLIIRLLALILVFMMVLPTFTACFNQVPDDENPGDGDVPTPPDDGDDPVVPPAQDLVKIEMSASKSQIAKGETVQVTARVTGAKNTQVTWSVSHPDVVTVDENGLVTMVGDITIDTIITVTATSVESNTVKATKTLIAKAPVVDGRVGELTSDMLVAVGNASITVSGTVTDVYNDINTPANSSNEIYEFTIEMADGAWKGSWNHQGSKNVIVSNYRRGDKDGVKDMNGNSGHEMLEMIIDKNNQVYAKSIKDYMSYPAVWESQHLWNHLGNLNVNKFTYDVENDVYKYAIDPESVDDMYLMTYFAFSLTPILGNEDTFMELYLYVENGAITKLMAQTAVIMIGDDPENPVATEYTTVSVSFSNVGTTVVPDPAPYTAPEYADKLQAALDQMKDAENYTFRVVDRMNAMPDTGDYELSSIGGAGSVASSSTGSVSHPYQNTVTATGTAGSVGLVTPEAIVIGVTGKYNYSLDGKNYHTEYSGYKQNSDGTYDEFESDANGLYGTKKVEGSIFDIMPDFDVSASIFRLTGMMMNVDTGKYEYTFALREAAITREVAMELCAYSYADDAAATSAMLLSVKVDEDGNLISVQFPYDLGGVYSGSCVVSYEKVGTTAIADGAFDNYRPRVPETAWSQYTLDDYYHLYTTLCKNYGCYDEASGTYNHAGHTATADVVLQGILGEASANVPSPEVLMKLFGDNISGPFYNWKEVNGENHGYMSITTHSTEFDENAKITNYEELMQAVIDELAKYGFTLSAANTDMSGGESGRADRYVTLIHESGIKIVIENNHTKYLWVYICDLQTPM